MKTIIGNVWTFLIAWLLALGILGMVFDKGAPVCNKQVRLPSGW